jgi:uncharacterized coiled-coil DUF342 family protein
VSNQNELNKIKKIDQRLAIIKEKTAPQNEDIKAIIEKRNKLNMKFNELQEDIKQKKTDRDILNQKVRILKENRDKIQIEIKKKSEENNKIRKKIDKLKERLSNRTNKDIQKEFNDIEWQIQTSTLDLREERELVEKAKILGTQLIKYEKIDKQNFELKKIKMKIQKLKEDANKAHRELTDYANKSQEVHVAMSYRINESKIIKTKADNLHASYLKLKEQYLPMRVEIKDLVNKKKHLLNNIKENEEKRKKEIEKNLRKKIKSEAKNKIKKKEKLSWDEFKILTESDPKNH